LRREVDVLPVDALVLPALDATTLLERWTDLAAARLAADRGAPILLSPPPAARGLLDRLLLRRLLRTPGVRVGGEEDLADFLAQL
jgi:sugar/nucleoside kinase (ribokinase family)